MLPPESQPCAAAPPARQECGGPEGNEAAQNAGSPRPSVFRLPPPERTSDAGRREPAQGNGRACGDVLLLVQLHLAQALRLRGCHRVGWATPGGIVAQGLVSCGVGRPLLRHSGRPGSRAARALSRGEHVGQCESMLGHGPIECHGSLARLLSATAGLRERS